MNTYLKRYASKYIVILAICAIALISCTSAPSSGSQAGSAGLMSTQMEIELRQRIYMAYLTEEGYAPRIDEDGDIAFRRESFNYYIIIDTDDPTLVYLLLPTIWSIDSDAERRRAANAVSVANRSTKVAKAYISGRDNDAVSISAELFLEDPHHFAVFFQRMIRAINTAVDYFVENM